MKKIQNIVIILCAVFSTATMGNWYEVLSDEELGVFVSPDSTKQELHHIYEFLMKKYQSNKNDERIEEITEAWNVLGNPKQRTQYDLSLKKTAEDSEENRDSLLIENEEEEEEPDCE